MEEQLDPGSATRNLLVILLTSTILSCPLLYQHGLRDPIPNYGLSAVLGIGGTKFGNLHGAVHV